MTTAATSLLGLALPVTGELNGVWGDVVNQSITSLLDSAVAGTTTISTDGDVTLTTTTLAANQAREAILLFSGARTAQRTVTAPAQSKLYTVINATTGGFAVKLVGAGPTTGLTIPAGASALVAWNGSDFVEIGATTLNSFTVTGSLTLTAGTANGVAYLNGSKVVTTGSALYFDGTSLGIGTTSPVSKLHVNTNSATITYATIGNSNGGTQIGVDTSGNSIVSAYAATPIIFGNNSSSTFAELMRLTSTGLGIGTSSVDGKLVVYGTAGSNPYSHFKDASGADFFIQSVGNSDCRTGTASNHPWLFFTNGSEKMRLDTAGNLGLGVTPSAWATFKSLTVGDYGASLASAGDDAFFSSNTYYNAGFKFQGAAAAYASLYRQKSGVHTWLTSTSTGTAGNAITFTQAMTLDASGNLLVGTTSALSGAARLALSVTSGQTDAIHSQPTSNVTYYPYVMYNSAGTTVGFIQSTNTATVFSVTSDYRLKNVIGAVTGFGERIDALEPIEYEWKSDGTRSRGFLAHKFKEVYSQSVTGSKDAVNAEGKPVYQGLQAGTSEVIADLVAEIQSLRKRLAAAGI